MTAPSGDSGTTTVEGTSFATALVTGGVTLLQQIYQSRFGIAADRRADQELDPAVRHADSRSGHRHHARRAESRGRRGSDSQGEPGADATGRRHPGYCSGTLASRDNFDRDGPSHSVDTRDNNDPGGDFTRD